MRVDWPNKKRFAFTFCDDTDFATLRNVKPVYDFLSELGIRSTKLVWLSRNRELQINGGDTCDDKDYVEWLQSLQEKGFEIALHNVAPSSSNREQINLGLERFSSLFDSYPRIHCNHTGCLDNLYWGSDRVSGWRRLLYDLWTKGKKRDISYGHLPGSYYFWGDIISEKIQYVRNFTCDNLNTLDFCPQMPYHNPAKPFVNFWFAATNASSPKYFKQNFTRPLIDKLVNDGGFCIAYVHFGIFYRDGKLDEHFLRIMEYLTSKEGWFAPVSDILDFLRMGQDKAQRQISNFDLQKLELKWFYDKFGKKTGI